jgi:hypothetical protein
MNSQSGFRPEHELLLCCATASTDADTKARMQSLLRREIDWKYLIDLAAAHGVRPLLCHHFATTCPESVSPTVLAQAKRYFQAHAFNNLFLMRELTRWLDLLERNGIPAIPWKGPVLAATAYGNVALRQFGDLDLLVRERDARAAKDLFLSSGYRLLDQVSANQEEAFYNARKVCELAREDGRVVVELHWAITSQTFPFRLDPTSLWERVERISLDGAPVRNLSPEDLLLVLCVHGAKHHWAKLMWISDIAHVLRTYFARIDWRQLMQRADDLGSARMLFLGLLLAHDLLGAKLPNEVLQRTRGEPVLAHLAGEVRSGLFGGGTLMAVERPEFYIQLRERSRDRFRCRLYLGYRMLTPQTQAWTLRLLHGGRSVWHFFQRA